MTEKGFPGFGLVQAPADIHHTLQICMGEMFVIARPLHCSTLYKGQRKEINKLILCPLISGIILQQFSKYVYVYTIIKHVPLRGYIQRSYIVILYFPSSGRYIIGKGRNKGDKK